MEGWTFDDSCGLMAPPVTADPEPEPQPEPEPEPEPDPGPAPDPEPGPVCLDGTHHFDVLAVPDAADGSSELDSTDGTCTGGIRAFQTVVSGAADAAAARVACAAVLGEGSYSVFHMRPWYPDAPADWWMCF
jgi:hypothetical protein